MMSDTLGEREVHVWSVRLDASNSAVARFDRLLSPDEQARAGRFVFPHLRRSFTIARGALRVLLGRYLNQAPAEILFTHGPKGKPATAQPGRLKFNLSHSGKLALIALTLDCELGVDVEHFRPSPDLEQLAARFFCADETADLMSLPPPQREAAFFRCWTRKEAYIKAIGDGLSAPLDAFAVTLRPDEPARLLHLNGDPEPARAWTMHDLQPGTGYAAAMAYRDAARTVSLLDGGQLVSS